MLCFKPDEKKIPLYTAFLWGVVLGFICGLAYMGKIIQSYEKELIIKEYKLETARKFIVDHIDEIKIGK